MVGASGGDSAVCDAFHECVGYAKYVKHVACGGLVEAPVGGVVAFGEVRVGNFHIHRAECLGEL